MNKIRCFFLFVFGGLLSATVMEAQEVDFEKEFDDFQKQQQKDCLTTLRIRPMRILKLFSEKHGLSLKRLIL